jgi:hypothetical protein
MADLQYCIGKASERNIQAQRGTQAAANERVRDRICGGFLATRRSLKAGEGNQIHYLKASGGV